MMSWDSCSLTCLSTAAKDAAARGNPNFDRLCEACENITRRLVESSPVDALDAITPERSDRSFDALAKDVRRSIEESEPEVGLDRLHTYVTKQIRILAEGRGVTTARDRPLHSIFGEYVKAFRRLELIETEMTERILKSSIATMEAFSQVHNNASLAHDNPTLSYEESLFIFNHVCSVVRFIRALEAEIARKPNDPSSHWMTKSRSDPDWRSRFPQAQQWHAPGV
jgi:hypothetical protein